MADLGSKKKKVSLWYTITHQKELGRKEYLKLINRVIVFVALAFLFSTAIFIVIALLEGGGNVIQYILTANIQIFITAFFLMFGSLLVKFIKWSYYIRKFRLKLPLTKSLGIYLSMYSMDLTPGNIGRVVSAYTLSKVTTTSPAQVTPIVIMDIFTDSIGFAILTAISAFYFNDLTVPVLIADILLLTPVFVFFISPWFYRMMKNFMLRHDKWKIFSIYGDEYFASQTILNKWDVYAVSILVSVTAAFMQASVFFMVLLSLGIHAPLGSSVFVSSSSQLFGMISALPGNLGVTDASLIAFSQQVLGITGAQAAAATIMSRLVTLWFSVGTGGVLLFYTLRYWKVRKRNA